jgi:hypothetical protein
LLGEAEIQIARGKLASALQVLITVSQRLSSSQIAGDRTKIFLNQPATNSMWLGKNAKLLKQGECIYYIPMFRELTVSQQMNINA